MPQINEPNLNPLLCEQFEDSLSDYLEDQLEKPARRQVAEHALRCPMCHDLLDQVKAAMTACQTAAALVPPPSANLEAVILNLTMPETAMPCQQFEDLLTDYLDGFLPANLFHRWERHAVTCAHCTNLPGAVVRSIGVCYTFKSDELPVPESLHNKILELTLGTAKAGTVKMPVWRKVQDFLDNVFQPILTPVFTTQFASVAMLLLTAFVIFTNAGQSDGSISGVYRTGAQLAAQTYEQSHDAVEIGLARGLNLDATDRSSGSQKTERKE